RRDPVVLLEVLEDSDTTSVVTLGNHDDRPHLERENLAHLASRDVDLDGVVDLDVGVGESEGTSIVRDSHGDLLGGDVNLLYTAEFPLGLFLIDAVQNEASLGVVEETEDVAGLLELDDVHETGGVVVVSSDLAVDLDTPLHADLLALLSGEGVLQTLTKDNGDGKALALLVRSGGGLRGPNASHLAQVPVRGALSLLRCFFGPRPMIDYCRSGGRVEVEFDSTRTPHLRHRRVHVDLLIQG
ncbi:hypothetical protein THAOC_29673, partial [Thalassiosira oceanica]